MQICFVPDDIIFTGVKSKNETLQFVKSKKYSSSMKTIKAYKDEDNALGHKFIEHFTEIKST